MQFTKITAIAFGLFAAQAMAQSTTCGVPGDQCNSPGVTACQCNGGDVLQCGNSASNSGYTWNFYGNCPSNPGGFTCVNGACVVN